MKRLYLLRHAQANHGGTSDKLRSLTTQGHSDAASMGAVMARQNYVPDYILCMRMDHYSSLRIILVFTI